MPLSSLKKGVIIAAALTGFAFLSWYFSTGPLQPHHSETGGPAVSARPDPEQGLSFPVVNIRKNWWESSGTVYYGIPARILFQADGADPNRPESIAGYAWAELDRIGRIFNPFDPCSDLSIFNETIISGRIPVSEDIMTVLAASRQLWRESNGFFDPTAWRIKRLWLNAEKNQSIPTQIDIASVLAETGFDKIDMDDPSGRMVGKTDPRVGLDFGGIVKGYAVDRVRSILEKAGATSGLIQLGGEVSAFGDNNGQPWRIGIQDPVDMNELFGILCGHGRISVSTSGNYRQPLRIGSQNFYHIFDPKTGRPVTEEILGVTTADFSGRISSATLDGAATAITVMGTTAGIAFARRLGMEALVIYKTADGSVGEHYTPGFSKYYQR